MTVSLVHRFVSLDPWNNLAREEAWLDALAPGQSALLLYVNRPCLVLGKHQNPLREVRLEVAHRRGLPLVRRATGGGTVWHGEGNLNWGLALPKALYDRAAVTRAVADALVPLGLSLEATDKGDLYQAGAKVSGSASLVRQDRVLHHGTLLCTARLEELHGVLGPTGRLVDFVGVASRPAPVARLGVEVEAAARALVEAFGGLAVGDGRGDPSFEAALEARAAALAADPWTWDLTPPFTWEGETRHGPARVRVTAGRVEAWEPLDSGWDDRTLNMSKIVGKRFFDPDLLEYIPTREAP